jgi:hypothetical protein
MRVGGNAEAAVLAAVRFGAAKVILEGIIGIIIAIGVAAVHIVDVEIRVGLGGSAFGEALQFGHGAIADGANPRIERITAFAIAIIRAA